MDLFNFVEKELNKYSEIGYKKFSSSLNPGVDNILGVRIPVLRKIAKIIVRDDWQKFLKEYKEEFMEETMLKGLVISYLNEDFDHMLDLAAKFSEKISNWAVCDTFCMGLKFINKNKKQAFEFLIPYLKSKDEFKLRFGVVILLAHFIDDEYIDRILNILFNLKSDDYYAQMGIAWAISVCYVKYPKKTLPYIKNNNLDNFTHNKAISKIIESYRVSKGDKDKLRALKRK